MPRTLKTLEDARVTGQELVATCLQLQCRHRWLVDLPKVIHYVGGAHSLWPVRGQRHFSERMRCPACNGKGVHIWMGVPKTPQPLMGGLPYAVENRDVGSEVLVSVLAKVGHISVAHAAFEAAVQAYPGRRLSLTEGAFVLRDSRLVVVPGGKKGA
ncbi:hypothetical protein EMQ25_05820 [Arsenicitalea aurantiaca]|uniref:Uncharacterized protein n=1 Tax=Arsenicitalea aurantiaca TaxID=1783274 RepID=A0A433XEZ8_9HYPH|nr:hypothetical protein [Arsenicitalea aurantiaca]RUT32663.1 hypothetical protein EMQ25_05820 [Arsenicitalea aurantiaca]